ncbi:MAG: hypothetical protein WBM50_28150 [Acidimicrobiales bacterium]
MHGYTRNDPPNLFDAADLPQPATIVPQGSIEANFLAFHEANPWVYTALVRLARDMNRRPIGIGMLFEVIRWQYARATVSDDGLRLNNNFRSRYARLIMEQEPDLAGVFQIRELTTP